MSAAVRATPCSTVGAHDHRRPASQRPWRRALSIANGSQQNVWATSGRRPLAGVPKGAGVTGMLASPAPLAAEAPGAELRATTTDTSTAVKVGTCCVLSFSNPLGDISA